MEKIMIGQDINASSQAVARRYLGWSVKGNDKKSQVFDVQDGDITIANPSYEWAIDQVTDKRKIEDIFQRRFNINLAFGFGSIGLSYTNTEGSSQNTEVTHTVISFVRRTACSLNRVRLSIRENISDTDFGDSYIAQGEIIASCLIIIKGELATVDTTKKNNNFKISAKLFKDIFEPHFSQGHLIKDTTAEARIDVQVNTTGGVSIPLFPIKGDSFDADIKTLYGNIERYFSESGGEFHFTPVHLRPYVPSVLKSKYERLAGIIGEIKSKLPEIITVSPADQKTWGEDLKRKIDEATTSLSPLKFYQSESITQQDQSDEQEKELKEIGRKLAGAVQTLIKNGFVSLNDYFRFQVFGKETLELAPDSDLDDRLAYVKNNQKSFKVEQAPQDGVTDLKRFYILTDEGLYLTKKGDAAGSTVRLTDVLSEAAVWDLERISEKGYKLVTKIGGGKFYLGATESRFYRIFSKQCGSFFY